MYLTIFKNVKFEFWDSTWVKMFILQGESDRGNVNWGVSNALFYAMWLDLVTWHHQLGKFGPAAPSSHTGSSSMLPLQPKVNEPVQGGRNKGITEWGNGKIGLGALVSRHFLSEVAEKGGRKSHDKNRRHCRWLGGEKPLVKYIGPRRRLHAPHRRTKNETRALAKSVTSTCPNIRDHMSGHHG